MKKTIGIDARLYGPVGKGLGRYTKEVVDGVLHLDAENNYVIFLCQENYEDFIVPNERVKKVLVHARWYSLAEQIVMPFYIWREKVNLMHFPHFNVPLLCFTPFVLTVHDLILTKFPTQRATTLGPLLYRFKHAMYKVVISSAVRRARKIITVSLFTKKDIIEYFHIDEAKIEMTYEGVSQSFERTEACDKNILLRYNIKEPFLLYVGNAYPHKNLDGLLDVYAEIRKKIAIDLVLIGREDYFYKRIKDHAKGFDPNISKGIIFPGFVPDIDLTCLYKAACAYVFPSFFEGFGLPPLEAMAQGCAVVSSNKTCLPEILGEAASYFNPEDKLEMQKKIEEIIQEEDFKKGLITKGYEQAKLYDWNRCAKETLNIFLSEIHNS